jgi:hypothetical protein
MKSIFIAGVAQLVERFIRNEKVGGSIPFSGTTLFHEKI